jgi:hypothetical protein
MKEGMSDADDFDDLDDIDLDAERDDDLDVDEEG